MADPAQLPPAGAAVSPRVAPTPVVAGRRILFVMYHWGYLRHFESAIRLLAARGYHIQLAFETSHKGDDSPSGIVSRLLRDCPTVTRRTLKLDDEREPWVAVATFARTALDYLWYLESPKNHPPKVLKRARKYVHPLVLRATDSRLGRSRAGLAVLGGTLRTLERAAQPGSCVGRAIDEYGPGLVLVTPLVRDWRAADFLVAARDRGIRCGVCVASWDNLSTKGTLNGAPDFVTVWNETQRREAIEMHGIDERDVLATGAQGYDHWFAWEPSRSRAEFCAEVGLDPSRPYVLYMCSSTFIAGKDEPAAIARWVARIRSSDEPELQGVGILVRPHPMNLGGWTSERPAVLSGETVVWPTATVDPDDAGSRNDFFDSIYHSAAVVGINTSSLIESAIIGRPVLSLIMPEFENAQGLSIHFSYLQNVAGGVLHASDNFATHARELAAVLRGEREGARREAFLRAFVRPHGLDRPAAPVLATVLEDQAARSSLQPELRLRRRAVRGLLAPFLTTATRSLARTRRPRRVDNVASRRRSASRVVHDRQR